MTEEHSSAERNPDPASPIAHVVIVGGGAAGWLTAGILAADHCADADDGLRVTVIEAPDIPILGVGEGTWPSLRDTLRRIGLSETAFIRACEVSFKQGTRFDGWLDGRGEDVYFHPFTAPPSQDDLDALAVWRAAPDGTPFAEAVSHQVALCLADKAPKQAGTPEYAAVTNYAYHLDAGRFVEVLKEHCVSVLGVRHIPDRINGVCPSATGDIAAVMTDEHGGVEGDLFVDCTGMRALLIDGHYGAPLTDISPILFNDTALAVQAPYGSAGEPIASQTNATAVEAGWIWDIGLQTRRGVGHVYSSTHSTEQDARDRLSGYLTRVAPGSGVSGEDARVISFRSAFRQTPWVGNCVAVGMASGFVEPLEASAIVMVELSAMMMSDCLPARMDMVASAADRFNARFAYRWSRIADFLKLHYCLSQRAEPFWRDHRDPSTWSDRLAELLDRWRYEPPSREDFTQSLEIFPAASYAYVLYGMGFKTMPPPVRNRRHEPIKARRQFEQTHATAERFLAGLPTNRQLVNHIRDVGFTRV